MGDQRGAELQGLISAPGKAPDSHPSWNPQGIPQGCSSLGWGELEKGDLHLSSSTALKMNTRNPK